MTIQEYLRALIGIGYQYGGDDPISGFDCSGLGSEILRAFGAMPWNYRNTAQGIYDDLMKKNSGVGTFAEGVFAFYGPSVKDIRHVAILMDSRTIVEAGGGNAETTSDKERIDHNAFVRPRPVKYRRDFLVTIKPTYIGAL